MFLLSTLENFCAKKLLRASRGPQAVHWYRRAEAAGNPSAAGKLHRLGSRRRQLPQCDNAQLNTFLQQFERMACMIRVYILTDTVSGASITQTESEKTSKPPFKKYSRDGKRLCFVVDVQ